MSDFQGLQVLIVEDEELVAMLLEDMLADLGCEVTASVRSLTAAFEAIEKAPPQLAILDVSLAGKQVFPVAEALAEKGLPFIFSSGYGSSIVPSAFKAAPVLPKPFQPRELVEAIRTAVGG
jgi:CheY-like chemotaxis protein